jgi:hypothetical protein
MQFFQIQDVDVAPKNTAESSRNVIFKHCFEEIEEAHSRIAT